MRGRGNRSPDLIWKENNNFNIHCLLPGKFSITTNEIKRERILSLIFSLIKKQEQEVGAKEWCRRYGFNCKSSEFDCNSVEFATGRFNNCGRQRVGSEVWVGSCIFDMKNWRNRKKEMMIQRWCEKKNWRKREEICWYHITTNEMKRERENTLTNVLLN